MRHKHEPGCRLPKMGKNAETQPPLYDRQGTFQRSRSKNWGPSWTCGVACWKPQPEPVNMLRASEGSCWLLQPEEDRLPPQPGQATLESIPGAISCPSSPVYRHCEDVCDFSSFSSPAPSTSRKGSERGKSNMGWNDPGSYRSNGPSLALARRRMGPSGSERTRPRLQAKSKCPSDGATAGRMSNNDQPWRNRPNECGMESWPVEPLRPRRKLRGHIRERSGTYPCERGNPIHHSNQPVDVDEVSASSFGCGVNNNVDCRESKSVPDESELDTCRRFGCPEDRGKMLSQLGMDVSREDSEFSDLPARRTSLDCNYQIPMETVYENFGVERKLVVLRPATANSGKQASNKADKRFCKIKSRARTCLGNIGKRPPSKGTKSEEMKTKVLSLIRGKHPQHSTGVPTSIVAVASCREDQESACDRMTDHDRQLTRGDVRVLSNQRVPQAAADDAPQSTPFDELSSTQRKGGATSPSACSCGDTTVRWGNGRKERTMLSSRISI